MQNLIRRSGGDASAYTRVAASIASAVILTFFAMQIVYAHDTRLPYKIGIVLVIVVVGVAGIYSLLTPEPDDPLPSERLYTADEVAALVAAVQAGRLVAAAPETCKFCGGAQPDAHGVDGTRYHVRCFQTAYKSGKT